MIHKQRESLFPAIIVRNIYRSVKTDDVGLSYENENVISDDLEYSKLLLVKISIFSSIRITSKFHLSDLI